LLRIIIDTNVFVSGVFFGGNAGRILEAWTEGEVQLVLSPEIYKEYERVFDVLRKRYSDHKFQNYLGEVVSYAEFVDPPDLVEGISRDPDDDKFLACAIAGKVPLIISGDGDLLDVSGYTKISIITPRAFCDNYLAGLNE
jgi:putative PIN family toxin of toxin-antitoxin system